MTHFMGMKTRTLYFAQPTSDVAVLQILGRLETLTLHDVYYIEIPIPAPKAV